MSFSPVSVTVTPGSTALLESVTVPVIEPVWTCATAADAARSTPKTARATPRRRTRMQFLLLLSKRMACILPPKEHRWVGNAPVLSGSGKADPPVWIAAAGSGAEPDGPGSKRSNGANAPREILVVKMLAAGICEVDVYRHVGR